MPLRRRGRAATAIIVLALAAVLGPHAMSSPVEASGAARVFALTANLPTAAATTLERAHDPTPVRDVVPWALAPAALALTAALLLGATTLAPPAPAPAGRRGTRRDRAPPAH